MEIQITAAGIAEAEDIIYNLRTPSAMNRVLGPSLLAQARVARDFARRPNRRRKSGDDFRDRTQAERAAAGFPNARGLRKTIRAVGATAIYGGKRFRNGRAAVFAGGRGARQAYLVHDGHGGPWPARPYRFLRRAVLRTSEAGFEAFIGKARVLYARLAVSARMSTAGRINVTARTVSRRARSRR